MNVAFLASHHIWPAHYETAMELMQQHLDAKDHVMQLHCDYDLPTCDLNLNHTVERCTECISKRKAGLALLNGEVEEIRYLNVSDEIKSKIKKLPTSFRDLSDLVSFEIENYKIGYSVASSVVTLLQEPYLDTVKHKRLIYDYLYVACSTYYILKELLVEKKVDKLYIYNGRFAQVRAALSACLAVGVDCILHENGCDKDHYSLYYNKMPQNKEYIQSLIVDHWNNSNLSEEQKIEIGSSFYRGNFDAKDQGWISFVKNQQKGLMPENWDPNKKNIVIYNSTEDEFFCLDQEWQNDVYPTQLEGIKRIIKDTENWEGYHFYLRVHPHLHIKKSKELIELYKLDGKNFTLIKSDSEISSYSLLHNCDQVLTFGSTMGIEATFWDKPSIVAGMTNYDHLDVKYKVTSHEQLLELLQSNLQPKDKKGAFIYGFYYKTFGVPFKHYKAESVRRGLWNGVDLHANYAIKKHQNIRRGILIAKSIKLDSPINQINYFKAKRKFF